MCRTFLQNTPSLFYLVFSVCLEKLKAELDYLWRAERPDTTQKVSWAAMTLTDTMKNKRDWVATTFYQLNAS